MGVAFSSNSRTLIMKRTDVVLVLHGKRWDNSDSRAGLDRNKAKLPTLLPLHFLRRALHPMSKKTLPNPSLHFSKHPQNAIKFPSLEEVCDGGRLREAFHSLGTLLTHPNGLDSDLQLAMMVESILAAFGALTCVSLDRVRKGQIFDGSIIYDLSYENF
ncbi:hypothetical protein ACFX19_031613 [Malus domestica]